MTASRSPSRRRTIVAFLALAGGAALFACVDLFHSTDFPTICEANPAACPRDTGAEASEIDEDATPGGDDSGIPPIDFCQWTPAEARARAEHVCSWMSACVGLVNDSRVGVCMLHALSAYDCAYNPVLRPSGAAQRMWSCLAEAKTCDAIKACVYGSVQLEGRCAVVTVGTFTSCSGSTLVQCGVSDAAPDEKDTVPPVALQACDLEGRQCTVVDTSTASCTGKAGATACAGASRCEGSNAIECRLAKDIGLDCASFGAGRCEPVEAGVACAPIDDAGACTGGGEVACDDAGVAHSCVGGREVTIDCNALEMPCTSPASALDPTLACEVRDASAACPDSCAGKLLKSCARGKAFQIDCEKEGLGTCVKSPSGVAACTLP